MKKAYHLFGILLGLWISFCLSLCLCEPATAQSVTNTFTSGQKISASAVNKNFADLSDRINNQIGSEQLVVYIDETVPQIDQNANSPVVMYENSNTNRVRSQVTLANTQSSPAGTADTIIINETGAYRIVFGGGTPSNYAAQIQLVVYRGGTISGGTVDSAGVIQGGTRVGGSIAFTRVFNYDAHGYAHSGSGTVPFFWKGFQAGDIVYPYVYASTPTGAHPIGTYYDPTSATQTSPYTAPSSPSTSAAVANIFLGTPLLMFRVY